MNWLASINWESVLVASVVPVIGLVALFYQEYRKRKNAREQAENDAAAKREPTWNELVTENRNLRDEVSELNSKFDSFREEFLLYKTSTTRKIDALVEVVRETATQWPSDREPPVFEADTLAALENTDLPVLYRGRVRPGYGLS